MILDVAKFESLSPGSSQRVLCRCDECRREKLIIRQSISRTVSGTYRLCRSCAARVSGRGLLGFKHTDEHRRKTGLASKGRKPSALHIERSRIRFTGPSNPNWNPDREAVARKERARRELYCLLHNTLKRLGTSKAASTSEVLGYSAEDLVAHLEARFLPGMSWADRGAWHIDHRKSVARFVSEGVTDPKIINALSNLQPLWKLDNLRKSAAPEGVFA